VLEQVLLGVVVQRIRRAWIVAPDTQLSLEHGARNLPRPEAWDFGASGEVADGFFDRFTHLLGRKLNLEYD
jgi:hypothetical protein